MSPTLEYYADELLQHRFPVNEIGEPLFDWGETTAGDVKEKTIYVKNTTHDSITLRQPRTSDEDFKIRDFPTRLKAQETGILKLEFAPGWRRVKPLDSTFSFDKIIG